MKKTTSLFWISLLLFWLSSCNLDKLDFNKLSDEVNLNPTLVAPIANAHISVWDLLQSAQTDNGETITKDESSGIVKIVYHQNDLFNYDVRDFVDFPAHQSFSSGTQSLGTISPGDLSVSRNITLNELANTLGGGLEVVNGSDGQSAPFPEYSFNGPSARFAVDQVIDYTSITISDGTLGLKLENRLKVTVSLTGSLFDVGYNREIANFTFTNVAPNEVSRSNANLAGIQMSSQLEFRMESFKTPGSASPVDIDLNDNLKITFELKDLEISEGNLMIKTQVLEGFSGVFSFVFPEPEMKAYAMVLKRGSLNIETRNSSNLTGTLSITLNEIRKNGVPITIRIPLNRSSVLIDLSGTEFNFASDPDQPFNQIPYTFSFEVNPTNGYVSFLSTDAVELDISLNDLQFQSMHGDFGQRMVAIDPGTFKLDVDLLDKIEGSFKLSNPKLELIIRNSIGMPASVSLDLQASNKEGVSVDLNPPIFDIPVPANVSAGIVSQRIIFDRENSNLVDFIALPPTGPILYSGQVDFNSILPVTKQNPNFLDIDATFAIDLAMELPLEMLISNLAFKDTSAISGSDYEKVESADLIIQANNGIPLDIDMQLIFIDTISNSQFGTSKKAKILNAARLNSSGDLIPVQSSQTIRLDANDLVNLRKSNAIVFSGSLSSPSQGTEVATIYADSELDLNVLVKAIVNL